MSENIITLSTLLPFARETGYSFCSWLKETYPNVSDITYNERQSDFTVKGINIANDQIRFIMDLEEFVADKLNPTSSASDPMPLLDDTTHAHNSESEHWESKSKCLDSNQYTHMSLLKHVSSLTETKITVDQNTKRVTVSGDPRCIQQALDRLNVLDNVLILTSFFQHHYRHHTFLPQNTFQLQMIPFGHHTAAATIRTLATPQEWQSISIMGVLVPYRKSRSQNAVVSTPTSPVVSRYWESYTFVKFDNGSMPRHTLSVSDVSSMSSINSRNVSNSEASSVVPSSSRPKGNYLHFAPEKAKQVEKWVNQNTLVESDDSSILSLRTKQSLPPPSSEEASLEKKDMRGPLRRRAKQGSNPKQSENPIHSRTEKGKGKAAEPKNSSESWSPLKPTKKEFFRTMAQKTAPGTKLPANQVTLEDCWLDAFTSFKKENNIQSSSQTSDIISEGNPDMIPVSDISSSDKVVTTSTEGKQGDNTRSYVIRPKEDSSHINSEALHKDQMKWVPQADSRDVEEIFNAMKPTLERAKCFPGILELELHIELIAIAPFSTDQQITQDIVTLKEWRENFQPKKSSPLAPFWIWNKVTADGAEIDAVVDLKWSKKTSLRMFEEEPADRGVVFEYHCRTKDNFTFVIIFDEAGQARFQQTESNLGSSTIHFPHRVWDLNFVLKGAMNFHDRYDAHLKAAIHNFVKSVCFEPGSSLGIYCSEPANGLFSVDKILMKRWTRHRHLSADQETQSNLLLKVLEVQQFVIGKKATQPTLIRGRIPINNREECISEKHLWFELSIVSDEIHQLLSSNRKLEPGQKTSKWNPADLLGIETKDASSDPSPTARAIGTSGLGNMYRLGKAVLDRMRIGK